MEKNKNNNERQLSPAELKRKKNYEKVCEEMEKKGYKMTELTAGVVQANIVAIIVMLPFIAIVGWIFFIENPNLNNNFSPAIIIIFLFLYMFLIVLHEGIHGLTWGCFAKNHFRAVSFGVIWKALTPYCTCSDPLTKKQYILGGAMPTLILGFGLAAVATVLGNYWLWILSVLMILGGGGDFFIILKMLLYRPQSKDVLYFDHPYEVGVVAFEK